MISDSVYDTREKIWRIYSFLMFVVSLFSLHAYMFWHFDQQNLYTVFGLLIGVFFLRSRWYSFDSRTVIGWILVTIAMFAIQKQVTARHSIFLILRLVPIYSVIALRDEYKIELLQSFSRLLAVILAISVGGWILYLIGVPLVSTIDFFGEVERQGVLEHQYIFNNYFLFVQNTGYVTGESDMIRFSSIFLEPGYFAILLTFLLYIKNFDMKLWENKIFILCLIMTLSLAGYIMVIFAFIAKLYKDGNWRLVNRLLGIGILAVIFYFIVANYNGGDNVINNLIFERLQWDETENNIAGYNRTNEALDEQYLRVITGDHLLWGTRDLDRWAGGVGYKYYIVMYGIGSLLLFVLSIFYQYKKNKHFNSLVLFILYIIMFARGHGTIFYSAFWLVYVCGIAYTSRLQYKE